MLKRVTLFLILNFLALYIGSLSTSTGVASDWYQNLIKAPWTPPGWMFGVAWSTIMICFAIYMAKLWSLEMNRKPLLILYTIQLILNISWNPVFFFYRNTSLGLAIILSLTVLVGYFFISYNNKLKWNSTYIAPYLLWLLIASSLNLYIVIYN